MPLIFTDYQLSELECWILRAAEQATTIKTEDIKAELSNLGYRPAFSIDTAELQSWIDNLIEQEMLYNYGLTSKGKKVLHELNNNPNY